MSRTSLALAALVGLLAPATAAPPASKADPNPKSLEVPQEELSKARELVQKLGNEAYTEREAAESELARMGRLARPALLDGVNLDPDPEVRARCSVLLPKANAEELKARLDAFLADAESKYEHDLPGWHRLRATVRGEWRAFGWTFTARPGSDKASRDLFIEFMQVPGGPKLLAAFNAGPEDLGRAVATEVALVVFAESQVNSRYVPRATSLASAVSSSGLQSLAHGSDARAAAVKAIMTAWFDSRTDPLELYSALMLARNMQNDDAERRLAGRMITTAGLQGFYKGQAMTTLVRLKAKDQLPALEKAFGDGTVLTTMFRNVNGKQVRQSIEVRDAALAAALVMTGQDPAEYGFEGFPRGAGVNFAYTSARLPEEKRAAAFFKYGWKRLKDGLGESTEP